MNLPNRINPRSRSWLAGLALTVVLVALPSLAVAQDDFADDTTEYFGDEFDDGYDDQYYGDEFFDEEGFDDGYFEEDGEFFDEGEGEFFDEDGEFYDDGEVYDEEGFEGFSDDEFLDDFEGAEERDDLNLADDTAGEVELEEIEKPKIKQPRVIRGYMAKLTVTSPWLAGLGFNSFWYSTIDARLSLDLPRKAGAGALAPAYTLEVATFSFVNQHPVGGEFAGVALQGLMRVPVGSLEAT